MFCRGINHMVTFTVRGGYARSLASFPVRACRPRSTTLLPACTSAIWFGLVWLVSTCRWIDGAQRPCAPHRPSSLTATVTALLYDGAVIFLSYEIPIHGWLYVHRNALANTVQRQRGHARLSVCLFASFFLSTGT